MLLTFIEELQSFLCEILSERIRVNLGRKRSMFETKKSSSRRNCLFEVQTSQAALFAFFGITQ